MRAPIEIRPIRDDELDFLAEMLCAAALWHTMSRDDCLEILERSEVALYVRDWGRSGDCALVAESAGKRVGAAWFRLFESEEHGYGFLDETVPELTIAVRLGERGRGIGTALLEALVDRARQAGHPALSLSVEDGNPAVRLYERLGFVRVEDSGNASTMRLDLVGR